MVEQTQTEKLRQRIAIKIFTEALTNCKPDMDILPAVPARENITAHRLAHEILQACKEAGLKFLPSKWELPSELFTHQGFVSETLKAIKSQTGEIEI